MKNILIFRTDRIGDFLVISSIFSSIKRNYKDCNIDIVCSKLNYDYIKTFRFFNKVFLYPDSFYHKIKFYLSLNKYDLIFVTDGKKRSIYISILKKAKFKYLFTPSETIKKIFGKFFNKVFLIDYNLPKIKLIESFLKEINCDLNDKDINFILNYENSNSLPPNILRKDYIILNFDEKWIFNNYIKTYKNIQPTYDQFNEFILKLSEILNVVIVNGNKSNPILNTFKPINTNRITIKDKINIFEFQSLIKNCKYIITCHGAPSHIASNYGIKIIDIIDESEKIFFESYNFHFKNKTQLIREDFSKLSQKILDTLYVNSNKNL